MFSVHKTKYKKKTLIKNPTLLFHISKNILAKRNGIRRCSHILNVGMYDINDIHE